MNKKKTYSDAPHIHLSARREKKGLRVELFKSLPFTCFMKISNSTEKYYIYFLLQHMHESGTETGYLYITA